MKKVDTRRVKVDQAFGLCHQRNLGFCSFNIENVAFHCTMIFVTEIVWTLFICLVLILKRNFEKCKVKRNESQNRGEIIWYEVLEGKKNNRLVSVTSASQELLWWQLNSVSNISRWGMEIRSWPSRWNKGISSLWPDHWDMLDASLISDYWGNVLAFITKFEDCAKHVRVLDGLPVSSRDRCTRRLPQ